MMRNHLDHHSRAFGLAGGWDDGNVDVVIRVLVGHILTAVHPLRTLLAGDLDESGEDNFIALAQGNQGRAIGRRTRRAGERMSVLISEGNALIALDFSL